MTIKKRLVEDLRQTYGVDKIDGPELVVSFRAGLWFDVEELRTVADRLERLVEFDAKEKEAKNDEGRAVT